MFILVSSVMVSISKASGSLAVPFTHRALWLDPAEKPWGGSTESSQAEEAGFLHS